MKTRHSRASRASSPTTMPDFVYEGRATTKSPVARRTSSPAAARTKSPGPLPGRTARTKSPSAARTKSPARVSRSVNIPLTAEEQQRNASKFMTDQLVSTPKNPQPRKRRVNTPKPPALESEDEDEDEEHENEDHSNRLVSSGTPTVSPAQPVKRVVAIASSPPLRLSPRSSSIRTSPSSAAPPSSSSSTYSTTGYHPAEVETAASAEQSKTTDGNDDDVDEGLSSVYIVAMFVAVAAVLVSLPYSIYAK
jgi:hypothetical protein